MVSIKTYNRSLLKEDVRDFEPFDIPSSGLAVSQVTQLGDDTQIIIFEVGNQRGGVVKDDLSFHHVVRGTIDNQAFAVGYCIACEVGV